MKLIGSYPSTRLRRNRKNEWSRRLVSENNLSPKDLIWPIFLTDGKNQKNQISTMPEVYRYSVDQIEKIVEKALKLKLPLLALFPHTQKRNKDKIGSEALNENNLVCKALRIIKKTLPKLKIHEIPSRTKVFDWKIPSEWNIKNAYVLDKDKKKIK